MPQKIDWYSHVEDLADRLLESLSYLCWVSRDSPLDCYKTHADPDPLVLATELLSEGYKVREEDLKLLKRMPDKYYKLLRIKLQRQIERAIRNLER